MGGDVITWRFTLLVCCVALFAAANARATTTITIDLGAPGPKGSIAPTSFSQLNGTTIGGNLSIDFVFAGDQNLRIFPGTFCDFQFYFNVNGSPSPSALVTGSAYLIDLWGAPATAASATGNIGGIGAYTFWSASGGAYDFHGIHFDLTFPNQPLTITNGTFFLSENGPPFLLTNGVPESGSSFLFLSLGALAIEFTRRKIRSSAS